MRIGADIDARCRKCGDMYHVVIAVVDARIVKVECRQCGARHRYRPVDGDGGASPRKATASRRRKINGQPAVDADLSRARRSFNTSETYQIGDRILHASLGEGVVQALKGATKVVVLFEAGVRTLICGRGGS
jgi:predicted  nucleic acid-binding Zn-ribbon protein